LKTRTRNRFPPPTPLKQLEQVLQEEWYKIPLETVQNLYESIQRRNVAVLLIKKCVDYLWEEDRLRVFENRVLRRIFGTKRDEVTGGWGELHNEELHNVFSSPV
jgi:PAS domain-containing protein